MKWAVIAFTLLTALFVAGAVRARAKVRTAEDNWDVVFCMLGAAVFGAIDFILIIVWLAIT